MVKGEKPDAVVIASPSSTHYEYLLQCVDSGVHIFCEKPFIWDDQRDLQKRVEDTFEKAREKKLIIAMNSQWPLSIDAYETLCGKVVLHKVNTFFVKMSPPFPGRAMIPESVPHAMSLLYCLLGVGEIESLSFDSDGEKEMSIKFSYRFETRTCDVILKLIFQDSQPRDLYVPLDKGSAGILLGGTGLSGWLGSLAGTVRFLYTGVRYTLDDNTASLPGHVIAEAGITARIILSGSVATIGYTASNLAGLDYEVMPGYPMPRFQHSLSFIWNIGI